MYLKQIDRVREPVQSPVVTKGKEISKVVGAEYSPLLGVLLYISCSVQRMHASIDIRHVNSTAANSRQDSNGSQPYRARSIPAELDW